MSTRTIKYTIKPFLKESLSTLTAQVKAYEDFASEYKKILIQPSDPEKSNIKDPESDILDHAVEALKKAKLQKYK